MKQFVITLFIILSSSLACQAQTYLEHLQKKTPGLGSVTVHQSKDIDELVNGKAVAPQDNKTKTTPQQPQNKNIESQRKTVDYTQHKTTEPQRKTTEPQHKITEPLKANESQTSKTTEPQRKNTLEGQKKTEPRHETSKETSANKPENKEENETPVVDMRKKVMRKSYKVTGYRVQAFAGGNSRNDRLKAEQTGNALKMNFPDQPVYVHFYSPRWICRMGNYRSLGEAQKVLSKVKAMGYKQACLVKGQITVQY